MVVDVGVVRNYIKPKADSTLYNMRKVDLIEYIRTLEHNYNVAVSFNENQARYIESLDISDGHKWIPVTERLPTEEDANEKDLVLAYSNDNRHIIADYKSVRLFSHLIAYWMPLPQPPNSDTLPEADK